MKRTLPTIHLHYLPGWTALFLVLGLGGYALPSQAQAPDWTVTPSDYESTMNVTGALSYGSERSTSTDDRVAAFVGTEVRGVAEPILIGGAPVYFLTIYANQNGETLTFKAYDADGKAVREVAETLDFSANAVVGTLASPYAWTAEGAPTPPHAPTLTAPEHEAIDEPTSLTLRWQAASGASSYHLHIADEAGFQNLLIEEKGWVPTSYPLSSLAFGTTYYWRVRSAGPGGESGWSAVFTFTTQDLPPPLDTPTLTAPLDGAQDVSRSPHFTWASVAGADEYRVQVATAADFSGLIIEEIASTPSVDVQDLAASTTHHWRVRSVGIGGEGDWSTVFTFTTEAEAPLAPDLPTLTMPRNGATGEPTSLALHWQSVAEADRYSVQVATDASFANRSVDVENVTATSLELQNLATSTTYHWRVRGVGTGGEGDWSDPFRFTTVPPLEAPAAPTLRSPASGTTEQPVTLTLQWNASADASRYDVQVATDETFTTLATQRQVEGQSQVTVNGLEGGQTYFWRVRAANSVGTSPWSEVFSFTTAVAPEAPASPRLLFPGDGTTEAPTTLTLSWQATDQATRYRVQVAPDASFDVPAVEATITEPALLLEALSEGTTYFWRVQAEGAGGVSPWSKIFRFATAVAVPAAPALLTPANDASSQATSLLLKWQAALHAIHYQLQVAADAGFEELLVEQDLETTAILVAHLRPGAAYYWRVRGIGTEGPGPWSAAFRFTTQADTPTGTDAEHLPAAFALAPNYPNPFHRETTLAYSLPHRAHVLLSVYNALGQEVARLVDAPQTAGPHQIPFDASGLPSGLYVYRLRAGPHTATRTMLLVRQ